MKGLPNHRFGLPPDRALSATSPANRESLVRKAMRDNPHFAAEILKVYERHAGDPKAWPTAYGFPGKLVVEWATSVMKVKARKVWRGRKAKIRKRLGLVESHNPAAEGWMPVPPDGYKAAVAELIAAVAAVNEVMKRIAAITDAGLSVNVEKDGDDCPVLRYRVYRMTDHG